MKRKLLVLFMALCMVFTAAMPIGNSVTSADAAEWTYSMPGLVSVENLAQNQIRFTWSKNNGALYRAYYHTPDGLWTAFATTTENTAVLENAVPGETYTFTVRSVSADGSEFTSNYNHYGLEIVYHDPNTTASETTAPEQSSVDNLPAPELTGIQNVVNDDLSKGNGIKVTWKAVPGAAKYRLLYKDATGKWAKALDTTSTSAIHYARIAVGEEYFYTVCCIDANGKAISSYDPAGKSITYYVPFVPSKFKYPAPIVSLSKYKGSSGLYEGFKISWTKIPGAAQYRVYCKGPDGKWKSVKTTSSTYYVDKNGISEGYKYTYTVRCVSADGNTFTSNFDHTGRSKTFTSGVTSNGDLIVKSFKPVSGSAADRYTNAKAARSKYSYDAVINQFKVETHYLRNGSTTYCNFFAKDVSKAMGAAFPAIINKKTGKEVSSATDSSIHKYTSANMMAIWLEHEGTETGGWVAVSAKTAQEKANLGYPTVAIWRNPSGSSGHVQVVRPENKFYKYDSTNGPVVAQAGAANVNYGHSKDFFSKEMYKEVKFYYHK